MQTAQLVRRAQSGNQQAFAELYRHYCSQLYYFARNRLKSDELAADCVQSCFLSVLLHLDDLRDPEKFRSWLYQTCSSKIADTLREEQRSSAPLSLDDLREEQLDSYDALQIPEEATTGPATNYDLDSEGRRALRRCLAALTDLQKDVIVLRYYAQLEPSEIAGILGISAVTVRKRLHDATAALRKQLTASGAASGSSDASGRGATADLRVIARLLQQDAEAAHFQGGRPEEPIALSMGAALPALLALNASSQAASRAQEFLAAARTGDASALAQAPDLPAGASPADTAGLKWLLSTIAGRVTLALIAAALIGGGGVLYVHLRAGREDTGATTTTPARTVTSTAASNTVVPATSSSAAATAAPTGSAEPGATPADPASTATKPGASAQEAPAKSAPAPAAVAAPSLTVAFASLTYPAGTPPLTASQLIAASGAVAHDSAGAPLPVVIGNLANVNTALPGTYLVFLHVQGSTDAPVITRTLRITIIARSGQ